MKNNSILRFSKNINGTYTCAGFDYDYIEKNLSESEARMKMRFVTIPSHVNGIAVTEIADKAFMQCKHLMEVYIPESVVIVGDMAFAHTDTLYCVVWHGSPTKKVFIGLLAFADCPKLKTITIGGFLHMKGYHAFRNCYQLHRFDCAYIDHVPSDFFFNCKSLQDITFAYCGKLNKSSFAGTNMHKIKITGVVSPYLYDGTIEEFVNSNIEVHCPSANPISNLAYDGITVVVEE